MNPLIDESALQLSVRVLVMAQCETSGIPYRPGETYTDDDIRELGISKVVSLVVDECTVCHEFYKEATK